MSMPLDIMPLKAYPRITLTNFVYHGGVKLEEISVKIFNGSVNLIKGLKYPRRGTARARANFQYSANVAVRGFHGSSAN